MKWIKRKFKFQTFGGPLRSRQKAKIPVPLLFYIPKKVEVFEPYTTAGSYKKKYPTFFPKGLFSYGYRTL